MPRSTGGTIRPVRGAIAMALLVSAAGMALTGCAAGGDAAGMTAAPPATDTATITPHPAVTGSPSAEPGTTIPGGYDRHAVYAACDAAVPAELWGTEAPLPPGPIVSDTFGPAATNPYTAEQADGDPDAVAVNVQYFRDGAFAFSALCVVSGDPAAPRVEFVRTLD